MIKVSVKTLFKDKAWIHQKYLRKAIAEQVGIEIEYQGKVMIVGKERIKPDLWEKNPRVFNDKVTNEHYYIWGLHFVETK